MSSAAQAASDSTKAEPPQPTEEYEGVVPVLGYLGDKLVGDLKTRLNLKSEPTVTEKIATRVKLKIGSLQVQRTEMRAVKE